MGGYFEVKGVLRQWNVIYPRKKSELEGNKEVSENDGWGWNKVGTEQILYTSDAVFIAESR